jgi:hypothetical protein
VQRVGGDRRLIPGTGTLSETLPEPLAVTLSEVHHPESA